MLGFRQVGLFGAIRGCVFNLGRFLHAKHNYKHLDISSPTEFLGDYTAQKIGL